MGAGAAQPLGTLQAGEGPTLLAVHGALTNGRLTFGGVLETWARHSTVVVCDRPGYELTPDPWVDIGMQARRLAATARIHDPPVDVLGCSYGGLVVLRALEADPGAFRSAVLVETPALDLCPRDMVDPLRLLEIARAGHARAAEDVLAGYTGVFAEVDAGLQSALDPVLRSGDPGVSMIRDELRMWGARLDRKALADAVSDDPPIPVLAVSGTRSHPAYRVFGGCIAAALSGRHHVIEGAGHAAHLHPRFDEVLTEFLGRPLEPGARR